MRFLANLFICAFALCPMYAQTVVTPSWSLPVQRPYMFVAAFQNHICVGYADSVVILRAADASRIAVATSARTILSAGIADESRDVFLFTKENSSDDYYLEHRRIDNDTIVPVTDIPITFEYNQCSHGKYTSSDVSPLCDGSSVFLQINVGPNSDCSDGGVQRIDIATGRVTGRWNSGKGTTRIVNCGQLVFMSGAAWRDGPSGRSNRRFHFLLTTNADGTDSLRNIADGFRYLEGAGVLTDEQYAYPLESGVTPEDRLPFSDIRSRPPQANVDESGTRFWVQPELNNEVIRLNQIATSVSVSFQIPAATTKPSLLKLLRSNFFIAAWTDSLYRFDVPPANTRQQVLYACPDTVELHSQHSFIRTVIPLGSVTSYSNSASPGIAVGNFLYATVPTTLVARTVLLPSNVIVEKSIHVREQHLPPHVLASYSVAANRIRAIGALSPGGNHLGIVSDTMVLSVDLRSSSFRLNEVSLPGSISAVRIPPSGVVHSLGSEVVLKNSGSSSRNPYSSYDATAWTYVQPRQSGIDGFNVIHKTSFLDWSSWPSTSVDWRYDKRCGFLAWHRTYDNTGPRRPDYTVLPNEKPTILLVPKCELYPFSPGIDPQTGDMIALMRHPKSPPYEALTLRMYDTLGECHSLPEAPQHSPRIIANGDYLIFDSTLYSRQLKPIATGRVLRNSMGLGERPVIFYFVNSANCPVGSSVIYFNNIREPGVWRSVPLDRCVSAVSFDRRGKRLAISYANSWIDVIDVDILAPWLDTASNVSTLIYALNDDDTEDIDIGQSSGRRIGQSTPSVTPNPVQSQQPTIVVRPVPALTHCEIVVENCGSEVYSVVITSTLGTQVMSFNEQCGNIRTWNLMSDNNEFLAPGVYFMTVRLSSSVITRPFVIAR